MKNIKLVNVFTFLILALFLTGCSGKYAPQFQAEKTQIANVEKSIDSLYNENINEAAAAAQSTKELILKGFYEEGIVVNDFVIASLPKPTAQSLINWYAIQQDLMQHNKKSLEEAYKKLADRDQKIRGLMDQLAVLENQLLTLAENEIARLTQEAEEAKATAQFITKMVSILTWCAVGATVISLLCFYLKNIRLAIYAGIGAACFGAGAYLVHFIAKNEWIIWSSLAAGAAFLIYTLAMKHGWNVRDVQKKTGEDENW